MADDRTDPQYKLRLTAGLKERIERAAKESGRSMNAEIVRRLEQSFSLEDVIIDGYNEAGLRAKLKKIMYIRFINFREEVLEKLEYELKRDSSGAPPEK